MSNPYRVPVEVRVVPRERVERMADTLAMVVAIAFLVGLALGFAMGRWAW